MLNNLVICIAYWMCFVACQSDLDDLRTESPVTYYVDSGNGNDEHDGLMQGTPWKSLEKVEATDLRPGDTVRFKRGSVYTGELKIRRSGKPNLFIIVTDYGNPGLPAPAFTNPVFDHEKAEYGNCIRLEGDYILVENLKFFDTPAEINDNRVDFITMWELGAVIVAREANHCVIRNNEFVNCGVGIKSNGAHTTIESNYIHDCNRVLKKWNWGPIGIWLGADYQEVHHNTIVNYRAEDPRISWGPDSYGGGADGSAIEIDDARFNKSHISIHHNFTKDCQGFLEVTWTDVLQHPEYLNFDIHHNISDDYQQFVALWQGANCRLANNTIIRRKNNANDWGVFNITQHNSKNQILNNIVVVEENVRVFNVGKNDNAWPNSIIKNNLYYAASDSLNIGLEGPGESPVFADPRFMDYTENIDASNLKLTPGSPAVNRGISLGYQWDFAGMPIPQQSLPDIGAFEFKE